MMKPAAIRKVVKEILAARGFTNMFRVRSISFMDLARDKPMFVFVYNWIPDPGAEEIKREVREKTGAIMEFYASSPR